MKEISILETIKNRRATPPRLFARKELSRESIQTLLDSAHWAPNHKKTEPWRFKVYTGNAKNELSVLAHQRLQMKVKEGAEIAPDKIDKFKSTLERVPVAMAIILQRDPGERLPEWEEVAAVSMAVQNMWLTATEMGLGAFWATPLYTEYLEDILGLKQGQKCLGFFYAGEIVLDYPSPGRGDLDSKVEWKE